MRAGMQRRAQGSCAASRRISKAYNRAQVCAAFRPGAQGRGRHTSRPRPPSPPEHNAACTLGRRPDTFNGDAARLSQQLPLPLPPSLPYNTTVPQHALDAAPSGHSVPSSPSATSIAANTITTTMVITGAGATTSTSPTTPNHPPDESPVVGTGPGPGSAAATTPSSLAATTPGFTAAAAVVAAWCGQLRALHLRAVSLHRRLDASLRDLDHLDLATAADQRTAERLSKVLSCYLSFQQHPSQQQQQQQHPLQQQQQQQQQHPSQQQQQQPAADAPAVEAVDAAATAAARSTVDLRPLLARVEAVAVQLAAIGSRHDADVYGPLRRFYFSADEPLLAISLRSEQYRRQLEAACAACGPGSPQVAALLEEVAAALSSHTVAAFLELDRGSGGAAFLELDRGSGGAAFVELEPNRETGLASGLAVFGGEAEAGARGDSSGGGVGDVGLGKAGGGERGFRSMEELAAAAAADYWCLQEARQELEVVGQSAEAGGIRLAELLRLADGAGQPADDRLRVSW